MKNIKFTLLVQFLDEPHWDTTETEREREVLAFARHQAQGILGVWVLQEQSPEQHLRHISANQKLLSPLSCDSSANQRLPSPSPTLIRCPGCRLKLKSFGASNSRTMVEPRLNSPTGSPFRKTMPPLSKEATRPSPATFSTWLLMV